MGQGLAIRDNLPETHCQPFLTKTEQFSWKNIPTIPHPTTFQQSFLLLSLHMSPNMSPMLGIERAVAEKGSCCS